MEGLTLEKLQVIIEAYTKPYRDEVEKLKGQTTKAASHVDRQTARMRNSFKKVGAAIASMLSIGAIIAFGKSCIDLGSDLAEVQNVVDVTFGTMSGAVNSFAKNAISQFGLSELTAKKYMGTYGAMAKSFGIVEEAGYQMSAAITGLTGDVASFYNLSTDEAYTKLKSIFTGETESLKELGVVMTQTALDQYALNNGFGKTTAKMTEQEKVMLRYQFVMSSLADAQGDFARTSDSWANQTRVLALQFESLRATIGQGLINAFTPVIRVINTILAKLQTLAAYFRAFTAALFGDAGGSSDAASSAASSMASAAGASGDVADNMGAAAKSAKDMKNSLAAFDELNNLSGASDSGGSGGGSGSAGGSVPDFGNLGGELFSDVTINPEVEGAVRKFKELLDDLRTAAEPTKEALKRLWDEGLAQLGRFTWTALKDFWEYFLKPLGKWTMGTGLPRFLDATNDLLKNINWSKLNASLRTFWKALEPFAEHAGEGLLWFYEHVLIPIADWSVSYIIPDFLERLADALNGINYYIEKVKPAFEWLGDISDSLDEKFGKPLFSTGLDKINNFLEHLGVKIELPSLKEIFSDSAVENALRSVDAFDVILDLADSMNMLDGLETWWKENVSPYLDEELWSDAWEIVKETSVGKWLETAREWGENIALWWNTGVVPWFAKEKWSKLYDSIKTGLKTKWSETASTWSFDISGWWNNSVAPWFTLEKWKAETGHIKDAISSSWSETVSKWKTDLTNWWSRDVVPMFTKEKWLGAMSGIKEGLSAAFEGAVAAAKQIWNKFAEWLNEKLTFKIDPISIMGQEVFGGSTINLGKIPTFAAGGFPTQGQMFIARESGPEMVGRIDGRTAVANNDQIVDSVAKGVYMAVSSAGGMNEDTLYRAFMRALKETDLTAVMDSDRAFKNMQKKAEEYRGRTGKPAFGW